MKRQKFPYLDVRRKPFGGRQTDTGRKAEQEAIEAFIKKNGIATVPVMQSELAQQIDEAKEKVMKDPNRTVIRYLSSHSVRTIKRTAFVVLVMGLLVAGRGEAKADANQVITQSCEELYGGDEEMASDCALEVRMCVLSQERPKIDMKDLEGSRRMLREWFEGVVDWCVTQQVRKVMP